MHIWCGNIYIDLVIVPFIRFTITCVADWLNYFLREDYQLAIEVSGTLNWPLEVNLS